MAVCPNCGNQHSAECVFCMNCGTKLVSTAPPPPPSPPQYHAPPPPQPTVHQKPFVLGCPRCNVQAPKDAGQFCRTCGTAYQMMDPPRVLINMCPRCNKLAPKGAGQFCETCGNAYQMMEPPSFSGGGVCPHCHVQVPPGSGKFCTYCGRSFFGESSISADNLIGELSRKLDMSIQRMALAAAAFVGIISCFMTWYRVGTFGFTVLTANAFRVKYQVAGLGSSVNSVINSWGFLTVFVFIAALALCFFGNRSVTIGKSRSAFIAFGTVNIILSIVNMVVFNGIRHGSYVNVGGGIGFGLILMVLMSIAVGAVPFIKKLER